MREIFVQIVKFVKRRDSELLYILYCTLLDKNINLQLKCDAYLYTVTSSFRKTKSRTCAICFQGEKTLPPSDVMWRDIATRSEALRRKFVDTQRHRIIVDFIAFGDELADKIGCSVNIRTYFCIVCYSL